MEGSWRMRTEIPTPNLPNYPPRRSTDYTTSSHPKTTTSDGDIPSTEDFADVFGGAPRTILSHQFSTPGFFYENIFRQPEKAAPVMRRGRNLPEFRIPAGKQSSNDRYQQSLQHGDIFGWEGERAVRSRSRSKASSSSALSSEELSPLRRPAISGDRYDDVSSFASKLRPINVKSRWYSSRSGNRDHQKHQKTSISENHEFLENLKNYSFQFNRRDEFPDDDLQFNSPASAVSSLSDMETCDETPRQDAVKEEEDDEDDESMRSYVIEINSDYIETKCDESNGVDEAIAWVKEMFHTQSSKDKSTNEHHFSEGTTNSSPSILLDDRRDERSTVEETSKATSHISVSEMKLLDEKIRMWSTGKEADIRLLLSSMHHWLAGDSGDEFNRSVAGEKAYQKAVLCLHPDKLQQRGATLTQKYIAEKAFSILQDAWAAFTSLDVFYS